MSDVNALDLEPGNIVGGYVLDSRLGGGAMGSVWKVRDGGGQEFAMKILRDSLSDGQPAQGGDAGTARERLRREALALKRVDHPGVCRIVDMELDDAVAFIVTELIEGHDLREDVRLNGAYEGVDLARLAERLTDTVKAVHAAGIIHRDIKPGNVMISTKGPVLVDFGIAMSENQAHVTRTGLVMGTPGFIAPEIIDGAESNEAADWWSLSSVLAYAATSKSVFGTSPMMAVLQREASGNADLSGLPAVTAKALRAALDPHPGNRPSPDQLVAALRLDSHDDPLWSAQTFIGNGTSDDVAGNAADSGATGVMPPFDPRPPAAVPDIDNPRTMWIGDSNVPRTKSLQCDPGTTPLPQDQQNDDPPTQMGAPAQYAPRSGKDEQPEDATDGAPVPSTQFLKFSESAMKRRARSGRIRVLAATVPLTLLSTVAPVCSILLGGFSLWILSTIGLSREFRSSHGERRGGQWRGTDSWLRALLLPWHAVIALARSLLLVLLISLTSGILLAIAMLFPRITRMRSTLHLGLWETTLSLPSAQTPSITGLVVAIIIGGAWLSIVCTPLAGSARMGAGSPENPDSRNIGQSLVIWTIASFMFCIPFIIGYPLTWFPLTS
ncbi:serine/threonine-protein kinase [uncultured Bifidobacterium sp.]|uniref:serine/threonine-protein kinase n=1 Tax=uncultured Bifidobacterium sp. TaxID=165187 RepID=UPI00261D0844|nr:serine/threonine-protein kinase [uncultured Bifidobacterium sp.]